MKGFFSARIKIFVILLSAVDHLSHFFILFFHSQVTQTFYKLRADPEQKHKSLKVHLEKDYPAWESPKPLPSPLKDASLLSLGWNFIHSKVSTIPSDRICISSPGALLLPGSSLYCSALAFYFSLFPPGLELFEQCDSSQEVFGPEDCPKATCTERCRGCRCHHARGRCTYF